MSCAVLAPTRLLVLLTTQHSRHTFSLTYTDSGLISIAVVASRVSSVAFPPSCDMKSRAISSSEVQEETDHHVTSLPT